MNDGILRIGKVNSIDVEKRQVRVLFESENMVSDWLKVIKSPPFIPKKDSTQQTAATSGGSGDSSFASHTHGITISPWMPDIDETVLCIYDPVFNGDGYVLGAL